MKRLFQRISLVVILATSAAAGCSGAPQFTGDEECFNAVDALWTAVTAQQTPWLEDSARELQRLRDSGQLSPEAWKALEAPIAQARSGQWEEAARELYGLIKAQRRQKPEITRNSERNVGSVASLNGRP